jgi:hypothetical protein
MKIYTYLLNTIIRNYDIIKMFNEAIGYRLLTIKIMEVTCKFCSRIFEDVEKCV